MRSQLTNRLLRSPRFCSYPEPQRWKAASAPVAMAMPAHYESGSGRRRVDAARLLDRRHLERVRSLLEAVVAAGRATRTPAGAVEVASKRAGLAARECNPRRVRPHLRGGP